MIPRIDLVQKILLNHEFNISQHLIAFNANTFHERENAQNYSIFWKRPKVFPVMDTKIISIDQNSTQFPIVILCVNISLRAFLCACLQNPQLNRGRGGKSIVSFVLEIHQRLFSSWKIISSTYFIHKNDIEYSKFSNRCLIVRNCI